MMPVLLDATWRPLVGYSIFSFGSPVDEFAQDRRGILTRQDSRAWSRPPLPICADFYCEDLSARLTVLLGEIHQISTNTACMHGGHNLVGCKADVALDILGNPPVRWIEECGGGLERYGHVDSMGLILEVPTKTDAVAAVILREHPRDHEAREQRARAAAAGAYDRRTRLRRRWPTPYAAANDVAPPG